MDQPNSTPGPAPKEPKQKPLPSYMIRKIRAMFKQLVADTRGRNVSAEEILQRCSEIKAVTQRKLYACGDCKEPLSAREMMRPCPHCAFTGNWKIYEAKRERKLNRELNKELKEARAYERERRAQGYTFK